MDLWPPLPREHGAWVQVSLATLAALLVAPSYPGGFWAWLGALWLAFLAHEPLLRVLDQRGGKAKAEGHARAWIWLGFLGTLAVVLAWLGGRHAPPHAWLAVLAPLACAGFLLPGILRGEEKSLPGELLAAVALGGATWPLALRAGASLATAGQLAGVLVLAFVLGTLLIRRFLAQLRQRPEPISAVGAALLTGLGAGLGLVLLSEGRVLEGLALLPLPLLGFRLFAKPWPPRHLKRLGWMMAAGNTAVVLLMGAALR
ncbi:MAG: YwiC-like family protein [Acidobacteria bacterium]|nr:YwiC-like family protein [Acidobacteriota bacterium]